MKSTANIYAGIWEEEGEEHHGWTTYEDATRFSKEDAEKWKQIITVETEIEEVL